VRSQSERLLLVGDWAATAWAILFYEKNGFHLLTDVEKDRFF
jgi:hypothetical protein